MGQVSPVSMVCLTKVVKPKSESHLEKMFAYTYREHVESIPFLLDSCRHMLCCTSPTNVLEYLYFFLQYLLFSKLYAILEWL